MQEEAASTEAAQREEDMASALTALKRQSKEEQRIEERLSQLHAEEAVLVANREQRLAQYRERRQQDHADALKREEELSEALKVAFCSRFTPSIHCLASQQYCSERTLACCLHKSGLQERK